MPNTFQQLTSAFPDVTFRENEPLAAKTYFKLGGSAEIFADVEKEDTLARLVSFCRQQHIPLTTLGGASNVIVADEGIKGLVIHVSDQTITCEENTITCGAGTKTALLVRKSIDCGLEGLEYFLGVPGTVGGAIFNNAHYLQDLIGEHVQSVKVITPEGTIQELSQEECSFGYDSSRFQTSGEIIFSVTFVLKPGNKKTSEDKIREATLYRAQTQPLGDPSSGCIFQNVPNNDHLRSLFPQFKDKSHVGGGFLIDQAGLKGEKIGGISVSHKHAAFLVNDGTGTSQDVKKLVSLIKERVKDKFGVTLKEEVFYLA